MNKKRLAINMTAQILAFAVNMGISFLIPPIIDRYAKEAYGFITLANNFVSYAQIIVSALNTMASRFITIHIHQKNEEEANQYFSSVFYANLFMVTVFLIPAVCCIVFINYLLKVPAAILTDVQILWMFVFLNFFISIGTSVFGIATYAKDRLDLISVKNIQSDIIRIVILVVSFTFFKPYVWYIGFASVVCSLYLAAANRRFTRQLLPEIKISRTYFRLDKVKELLSLGAWNSLTRLSQVLLDGLDLLITNIFLDAKAMAVLSYAKTVPTAISGLMGTIVGVFNPQITIAYAKGNKEELVGIVKSSNRILIYLLSIPIAFLTVFGDIFYSLWLPAQDAHLLHILSLITMGVLYVSVSIQVLYHVFIITKKVKANSIVMIISGVVTTAIVFLLLNLTDWGLFVIAGVSTVVGLIRNLLFTPLYASRCLGIRWNIFYGDILTGLLSIAGISAAGWILRSYIPVQGWFMLIFTGFLLSILALFINFFIVLKRRERELFLDMIKSKLRR